MKRTLLWCAAAAVLVSMGEWLLVSLTPADCLLENCTYWIWGVVYVPLLVVVGLAALWGRAYRKMPARSAMALALAAVLPLASMMVYSGGGEDAIGVIFLFVFGIPLLFVVSLLSSALVALWCSRRRSAREKKDETTTIPGSPAG
jgi:hypothetical protein